MVFEGETALPQDCSPREALESSVGPSSSALRGVVTWP